MQQRHPIVTPRVVSMYISPNREGIEPSVIKRNFVTIAFSRASANLESATVLGRAVEKEPHHLRLVCRTNTTSSQWHILDQLAFLEKGLWEATIGEWDKWLPTEQGERDLDLYFTGIDRLRSGLWRLHI
jgi:hypothetical protein